MSSMEMNFLGSNKRNLRASSTLNRPKLKPFNPSQDDLKKSLVGTLEMVKLARGGQPVYLPNLRSSGIKSSLNNPLDDF